MERLHPSVCSQSLHYFHLQTPYTPPSPPPSPPHSAPSPGAKVEDRGRWDSRRGRGGRGRSPVWTDIKRYTR